MDFNAQRDANLSSTVKHTAKRAARLIAKRSVEQVARPDWGFFGPEPFCHQVWGYPTSIALGFSRAILSSLPAWANFLHK